MTLCPAAFGGGTTTTEARACVAHPSEQLKLQKIVGCAMTKNHASLRVLEKVGMRCVGETSLNNTSAELWEIKAS
ncbi:MAG: GNAT family N-acetyltransferase [Catalinimonas sp.]